MVGRTNVGGGGAGCILEVAGTAGHTVKMSKSGKTYTKTLDSNGNATFKGLSTGEWTITMRGEGNEATRTINITADYAITITYFRATISVTYPAGSTCTCTHSDGTTLTASGTSGSYTFTVPKIGTWTVSCTDGSRTKSTQVSITAEGQSESVTITYQLYVFKSGSGVTSGHSVEVYGSSSKDNGGIYLRYDAYVSGAFNISPTVDLSKYSVLKFDVQASSFQNEGERVYLGVGSSKPSGYGNGGFTASASIANGDTSRKTITVDISNISGALYIKSWANAANYNVYNIWLE